MRILVTRPEEDGARTAARLAARGHECVVAPLMEIEYHDGPAIDLASFQAVLLTSANGVRALARRSRGRDVLALAVGDATAAEARAQGFTRVLAAEGEVHSLARLAATQLDPAGGPLLHAAGSVVAGDLVALLPDFRVERQVLYAAVAAGVMPQAIVEAFRQGGLDLALFYSPRTARIFMELAARAEIAAHLSEVTAGALSAAVASALRPPAWQSDSWRRIVVAQSPSEQALFDALAL